MDRRPPGIDPAKADEDQTPREADQAPRDAEAAATPDTLTEAEWDRILPPIDENDPEWQAYVRRKVRESLDDPRPDLTGEEVRESLRAHHEARLRRDS